MSNKKTSLFWILQVSGWILLLLIYLILYYRNDLQNTNAIVGLSITYITGFVITLLLRIIYRKFGYRNRSILSISFIIIFGSVITANIWFWFDTYLSLAVLVEVKTLAELNFSRYLSWIWSNSFVIFLWSALYFGIKLWNEWLEEKSRAEKSQALAQKAQLQMLRYQLNPHFLFNSLNSIRALVDEDKIRAKTMITELSEFLRYSLINKNLSSVPFRDELEAIKHYFSIEKTRFEEKLEVKYNVEPETENLRVPSFLIHPIIENAIKYGMKTSKLPLTIEISSLMRNDNHRIEICNSGNWVETTDEAKSTGTGINNVKQRLLNSYPDKHNFTIIKNDDRVCVRVEIFSETYEK